jgi:hypothetical protein
MQDLEEDLRSTGHSIVRDADRLKALERRKAELDPADDRVQQLSVEAERVATTMRDKAAAERELATQIQEAEATGA